MDQNFKFKYIYNPKSNRLDNYDYSLKGWYFITICTKNRENLFGEIINGKMILNDYGKIIYNEIKNIGKYNNILYIDEFIIMPNHLHLILIIKNTDNSCKDNSGIVSTIIKNRRNMIIPKIIGKFKMITSKQINIFRNSIGNQSWQPNYYDRIIRNNDELQRIRKYIQENPLKWELNKDNVENIFM